jgi:hypothetical protein
LRATAEGTNDAEARKTLLRMADDYDHLASLVTQRLTREHIGEID